MSNDKIRLAPQPFGEVTGTEFLAEGAWRFFRRNADNDLMHMDISIPLDLQRSNYQVSPIHGSEGWYWSVVDTQNITSTRGI